VPGPGNPAEAEDAGEIGPEASAAPDDSHTIHGTVALAESGGCLVDPDGGVRCWGRLAAVPSGEEEYASGTPLVVPGVADAVETAVGSVHACARTAAGRVLCWGGNSEGQLGDGTTDDRREAVAALGLEDAVDLAAGGYATCAVRAGGAVLCWGRRTDGPTRAGRFAAALEPTEVPDVQDGVEVALSNLGLGCVRHRDGRVACWTRSGPTTLTAVPELVDTTRVAAAGNTACAVARDGTVRCWGEALDFNETSTEPWAIPRPIAEFPPATQLAMGWRHVCVVTTASGVFCVGRDRAGELGLGEVEREAVVHGPVADLAEVVDLAAGPERTCARRRDGAVLCWGMRDEAPPSLLGDGALVFRSAPAPVPGLTETHALAAGMAHACAASGDDGRVFCWGANTDGQLGDGTREDRARPVPVEGVAGVRELAVSQSYSCARLAEGSVTCWGAAGAAGDAVRPGASPAPAPVAGLADTRAITAGRQLACALGADAAVRCWGAVVSSRGDAREGVVDVPELAGATSIRSDYGEVCGVLDGGRATCVLFGFDGDRSVHRIRGVQGLSTLAGELQAGCGVQRDGRVACWGLTRQSLRDLDGVVAVERALNNVCLLTADGVVHCWGSNATGQLGRLTTGLCAEESYETDDVTEWACDEDPAPATGLPAVDQVAMGDDFACARARDGTVWCWGNGRRGQLGDGVAEVATQPVLIAPALPDATD
jgi:alpha-tubulin suppressor-like RCC1 family protein